MYEIPIDCKKVDALRDAFRGVRDAVRETADEIDALQAKLNGFHSPWERTTVSGRVVSGPHSVFDAGEGGRPPLSDARDYRPGARRGGGRGRGDDDDPLSALFIRAAGSKFSQGAKLAGQAGEAMGIDAAAIGAAIGTAAKASIVAGVAVEAVKLGAKVTQDVAAQYQREASAFYALGAGESRLAGRAYGLGGEDVGAKVDTLSDRLRGDSYGAAWARGKGIYSLGPDLDDGNRRAGNYVRAIDELSKVKDIQKRVILARGLGVEDDLYLTDLSPERRRRLMESRGDIGDDKQRIAQANYRASQKELENKWAGIVAEQGGGLVNQANAALDMANGDRKAWGNAAEGFLEATNVPHYGRAARSVWGFPMHALFKGMANAYGGNTTAGRWFRDPFGGKQYLGWAGVTDDELVQSNGGKGTVPARPAKPEMRWRTDLPDEAQRQTRYETINGSTEGALPKGWNGRAIQDQGMMTAGARGNNQNAALDWMAGMLGAGAV